MKEKYIKLSKLANIKREKGKTKISIKYNILQHIAPWTSTIVKLNATAANTINGNETTPLIPAYAKCVTKLARKLTIIIWLTFISSRNWLFLMAASICWKIQNVFSIRYLPPFCLFLWNSIKQIYYEHHFMCKSLSEHFFNVEKASMHFGSRAPLLLQSYFTKIESYSAHILH